MFIRTKRQEKNGKVYTYRVREKRVWVNGKVKSIYLGRVNDDYERVMERALRAAEREAKRVEEYQRREFGETAAERKERESKEHLERLHSQYGLKLGPAVPVPVEPERAPALEPSPETKGPAEDAEPDNTMPSSET